MPARWTLTFVLLLGCAAEEAPPACFASVSYRISALTVVESDGSVELTDCVLAPRFESWSVLSSGTPYRLDCPPLLVDFTLPDLGGSASGDTLVRGLSNVFYVDGCEVLPEAGSELRIRVDEAVGEARPYPALVSPDYVRAAEIELDVSSDGLHAYEDFRCDVPRGWSLTARARLEAEDVSAVDAPADCRAE